MSAVKLVGTKGAEFAAHISSGDISELLSHLQTGKILSDEEVKEVKAKDSVQDSARRLIEIALEKGEPACRAIAQRIYELDQPGASNLFLCVLCGDRWPWQQR